MSLRRIIRPEPKGGGIFLTPTFKRPKKTTVLVGLVHYGPLHPRLSSSISNIKQNSHHDIRVAHHQSALVEKGRNYMVTLLKEINFEWLLFIDDDTLFPDGLNPSDAPSALDNLLRHQQQVVSGLAVVRTPPCKPVIYNWGDPSPNFPLAGAQIIMEGLDQDRLIRCDMTGAAFLLINRSVFEKLEQAEPVKMTRPGGRVIEYQEQPFAHLPGMGEDWAFFWRCKEAGIPIYCDTSFALGHVGERVYTIADWFAYKEAAEMEGQDGAITVIGG